MTLCAQVQGDCVPRGPRPRGILFPLAAKRRGARDVIWRAAIENERYARKTRQLETAGIYSEQKALEFATRTARKGR
jgi:hypothetical protein